VKSVGCYTTGDDRFFYLMEFTKLWWIDDVTRMGKTKDSFYLWPLKIEVSKLLNCVLVREALGKGAWKCIRIVSALSAMLNPPFSLKSRLLFGWLVGWSVCRSVGPSVGWLTGRSIGWLVGWLWNYRKYTTHNWPRIFWHDQTCSEFHAIIHAQEMGDHSLWGT
jgi:hypothetical protein